ATPGSAISLVDSFCVPTDPLCVPTDPLYLTSSLRVVVCDPQRSNQSTPSLTRSNLITYSPRSLSGGSCRRTSTGRSLVTFSGSPVRAYARLTTSPSAVHNWPPSRTSRRP